MFWRGVSRDEAAFARINPSLVANVLRVSWIGRSLGNLRLRATPKMTHRLLKLFSCRPPSRWGLPRPAPRRP